MLAAVAAAALTGSGCNLREPEIPPVTGPSVFALGVTMSATPDILPEDGASQSVIGIVVRDANGQPMRNVQLLLETTRGQLSASNVSTDANGRATSVLTSPRTLFPIGGTVSVFATPIGTNFDNTTSSSVTLLLVPPVIVPVPGAPVADFVFSPTAPKVGTLILFNASSSFDPNGTIVLFEWSWGDGDVNGFGVNQDHDFLSAGTFFVTLVVTDNSGLKTSVTKPITVSP